jgi:DNA-binding NarL/FixJ family response regulator
MMKILIADDHSVVRRGIKQIVTEEFPGAEVFEAANSNEIISFTRKYEFDLIVSDLIMPGKNAIEMIKDLRASGNNTPIIILSMHPEEQYAVRVLKAGGSGYLTKESAPEELVKAIQVISGGKKYISSNLSELLVSRISPYTDIPLHERLSDREFTVLKMIASGKTVGEIAQELNLGIPTISTYRARIMEKTEMKTNADIMKYAMTNQII